MSHATQTLSQSSLLSWTAVWLLAASLVSSACRPIESKLQEGGDELSGEPDEAAGSAKINPNQPSESKPSASPDEQAIASVPSGCEGVRAPITTEFPALMPTDGSFYFSGRKDPLIVGTGSNSCCVVLSSTIGSCTNAVCAPTRGTTKIQYCPTSAAVRADGTDRSAECFALLQAAWAKEDKNWLPTTSACALPAAPTLPAWVE